MVEYFAEITPFFQAIPAPAYSGVVHPQEADTR